MLGWWLGRREAEGKKKENKEKMPCIDVCKDEDGICLGGLERRGRKWWWMCITL